MDDQVFFPGTNGGPSEATRELVDREVRRIVDECYQAALEKLRENRERLESLTKALLEHETLDEHDAYRAAGFDRRPPEMDEGRQPAPDIDGVASADIATGSPDEL
jgi:cell division protease FtsH